ncbi:MAG TPA: hypothetical protein VJT84_04545 [Gaiellaceae bacterium]|nr:hypothetical protein [Gaiellaceae bacterium]
MTAALYNMTAADWRELDQRTVDGLEVSLLWPGTPGDVVVRVLDRRAGDAFELLVDGRDALDAFRHPYAYAAVQGVAYTVPARAGEPDAEPLAC